MDLVVIGHLMIEYIRRGDSVEGPVLGAPASYAAVSAARLGTGVGLVTRIGPEMPVSLLEPLFRAGVDLRGLRIADETRTTLLQYDQDGRKKVSFRRQGCSIDEADLPGEYRSAKAFLICPMDHEVSLSVPGSLRRGDTLMMTDLGGLGGAASAEHPRGRKDAMEELAEWVSHFDVVKASLEDCEYLFGEGPTPEEAAGILASWGGRTVLVTLGSEGALLYSGSTRKHVPTPKVESIDPTGAGDVFCASFLSEYLRTGDAIAASYYATVSSALLTTRTGGVRVERIPDDAGVRRHLASVSR